MNIEEAIEEFSFFNEGDYITRNMSIAKDIVLLAYEKEKEKNKEYKNLLIDMINQFSYEDNKPETKGSSQERLYTGGLSTLEDAFDILNIDEGIKREDLWKLKEE